jgi:outer membrane protein assembly factor BamB
VDSDFRGTWRFQYFAFDRLTGAPLWEYTDFSQWGSRGLTNLTDLWYRNLDLLDYMAPSIWRNLVIFTSGDTVVRAFHARTGRPVWFRTMAYPVSAAPTVAGNRVYFGMAGTPSDPPRLVALSARNGRTLWEMETEGELLSAPLVAGKHIIFGTDENVFYVLEELL